MSDDADKAAGRLSAAEEEEVFTSAARDPLAEPARDREAPSKHPSMISSGPFEIAPSSFSAPPPSRSSGPPLAVVENAMSRGRPQLSVSAIVAIAAAVIVVLIGLSLLLFR